MQMMLFKDVTMPSLAWFSRKSAMILLCLVFCIILTDAAKPKKKGRRAPRTGTLLFKYKTSKGNSRETQITFEFRGSVFDISGYLNDPKMAKRRYLKRLLEKYGGTFNKNHYKLNTAKNLWMRIKIKTTKDAKPREARLINGKFHYEIRSGNQTVTGKKDVKNYVLEDPENSCLFVPIETEDEAPVVRGQAPNEEKAEEKQISMEERIIVTGRLRNLQSILRWLRMDSNAYLCGTKGCEHYLDAYSVFKKKEVMEIRANFQDADGWVIPCKDDPEYNTKLDEFNKACEEWHSIFYDHTMEIKQAQKELLMVSMSVMSVMDTGC